MSRDAVFIDTTALVALASTRDSLHASALSIHTQLIESRERLVTSHWVLSEFLSGASTRHHRAACLAILDSLQSWPMATIVSADNATWDAALSLYRQRPDKSWSLVDCSSIYLCRRHRIRRVFTHDRHFAQAELTILLT